MIAALLRTLGRMRQEVWKALCKPGNEDKLRDVLKRQPIPDRLLYKLATFEPTHGSNGYKAGCRCELCKGAKSVENRGRRRARRKAA